MLDSTLDMYNAFLEGIKKEYTGTVIPTVWNDLMNNKTIPEWINSNIAEGIELGQKQIDELRVLRTIANLDPTTPFSNTYDLPDGTDDPKYLRFLGIMFNVMFMGDHLCYEAGTLVLAQVKFDVIRSDQKAAWLKSPYRKPSYERMYYDMSGNQINAYTINPYIAGISTYTTQCSLEYLTYPVRIFFDEAHPADAVNPTYTPGVGSVNSNLPDMQKAKLIDIAVRIYLESTKEERYRTYVNESIIRNQ